MHKSEDMMWKFPDLTYLSGDQINSIGSSTELMLKNEKIAILTKELMDKELIIDELKSMIEKLGGEISTINQYKEKMYLDFQDAVQDLFKQIKTDGLHLVEKMTRLLINHEIKTDPDLIKDVLNQLLDKVTDHSQIFVEVSPADFLVLKDFPQIRPISLIENINLQPGNIVIKQHHQGLIYDIDNAISEMLGT